MESEEVRRGYTGRAFCAFSPWIEASKTYSILQLYLGNNPLSKLEVVSSLNSFNIADAMYHYNSYDRPLKYNPKVFFGTIQTVSIQWKDDLGTGSEKYEKSGSYSFY